IADHTFIVRTDKIVAQRSSTAPASPPGQALINIMAGNYARHYRIFIGGVNSVDYKTPDGGAAPDNPLIDTTYIPTVLTTHPTSTPPVLPRPSGGGGAPAGPRGRAAFPTGAIAGGYTVPPWAMAKSPSTFSPRHSSSSFTLLVEDGMGGRAMKEVTDEAAKF